MGLVAKAYKSKFAFSVSTCDNFCKHITYGDFKREESDTAGYRGNPQRFETESDFLESKEWTLNGNPIVTIPVNTDVSGKDVIVSLEAAERYLKKARRIALRDCGCRTHHHNCDSPLRTCISFDKWADMHLEDKESTRHPEEISVEHGLKVLKEANGVGLVFLGFTYGEYDPDRDPYDITSICACCACCCGALKPALRYRPDRIIFREIAATDGSLCTDCGNCVDVCNFGARKIEDGIFRFDASLCYGCGMCVSKCPENAISMIPK